MALVQPSLSAAPGPGKRRLARRADELAKRQKTQVSTLEGNAEALPDLLAILSGPENAAEQLEAIHALHRTFTTLIADGQLHAKGDGAVRTVRLWLRARQADCFDRLGSLLLADVEVSSEIRSAALVVLFDLLEVESSLIGHFASKTWSALVKLFVQPLDADARAELVERWIDGHDDLRYYFLRECRSLSAEFAPHALAILESLEDMPSSADDLATFWTAKPIATPRKNKLQASSGAEKKTKVERGIFDDSSDDDTAPSAESKAGKLHLPAVISLSAHRKAFQAAWLSVLPNLRDERDLKRVLVVLHRLVLPHLVEPAVLMDFLADCCDHGGTVALLALNGLFTLITKFNLDYPDFYMRLYALLDRQVLHVRYRPRFFRMLAVFLSSSHLPIALVAAFIKRLSRLSLSAPPAAIVTIVPFVYNLLKRHPTCMVLIHRAESDVDSSDADPYLPDERDPLQSRAIESSIWELVTMRKHYLASTATLSRIFAEPFSKPQYDMEDFLDHAYASFFETEMARKIRNAPALDLPPAEAKTVAFFPLASATIDDMPWSDSVTELWRFGQADA